MEEQDKKWSSSLRSKEGEEEDVEEGEDGEEEEEEVGIPSVRITSEKEGSWRAA